MKKIYVTLGLWVVFFVGFWFFRSCDNKQDEGTVSTTLAPGVVEKIVVNPYTHKLSLIRPEGMQELFLPDRPSSIEIDSKGKTTVTSRQWGTELRPFVGFHYSNAGRIAAGVDLLYYKKLDLGLGMASQIGNHTPIGFVKLSYCVLSNTQIGVTYDTGARVGGIITVRF